MLSRRKGSAGCKAYLKCFRVAKEAVVRQFAKAALDAETDVGLSAKAAEGVVKVANLVPDVATAVFQWSLSEEPPLYQCMTGEVVIILRSLFKNVDCAS